jgi:hypothetical protein
MRVGVRKYSRSERFSFSLALPTIALKQRQAGKITSQEPLDTSEAERVRKSGSRKLLQEVRGGISSREHDHEEAIV